MRASLLAQLYDLLYPPVRGQDGEPVTLFGMEARACAEGAHRRCACLRAPGRFGCGKARIVNIGDGANTSRRG